MKNKQSFLTKHLWRTSSHFWQLWRTIMKNNYEDNYEEQLFRQNKTTKLWKPTISHVESNKTKINMMSTYKSICFCNFNIKWTIPRWFQPVGIDRNRIILYEGDKNNGKKHKRWLLDCLFIYFVEMNKETSEEMTEKKTSGDWQRKKTSGDIHFVGFTVPDTEMEAGTKCHRPRKPIQENERNWQ